MKIKRNGITYNTETSKMCHEHSFIQGEYTVTHRLYETKKGDTFLFSIMKNNVSGKEFQSILLMNVLEYYSLVVSKEEDLKMLKKTGKETTHYHDCWEMVKYNHLGRFLNREKPKYKPL